MPLADLLRPEVLILIVGVVVTAIAFFLLRGLGKRPPEDSPVDSDVQPEVSAHGERRAVPRKKTPPVVVDLIDPEGKRPRMSAVVADRSTGGLALHSQDEIPVDTQWNVVPRSQRGTVKVSVLVEVRSCVRGDKGFQVGCQFLRTVNYNELMNFE